MQIHRGNIEDIAERVLAVLLSSTYRKNSLTAMQLPQCAPAMISSLARCIRRDSPIQITLLAFPFKVPNPAKVGARALPDFAELAAIRHCLKLNAAIRRIYSPGLQCHILHDGLLIADVFGIQNGEVLQYQTYFSKLVAMEASDVIHCHNFSALQTQNALDWSNSIDELQFTAERWFRQACGTAEWITAFRKTLGMINLRDHSAKAVVNLLRHSTVGRLPVGWEDVEQRVHKAMIQYRVADAVIHQYDPRPLHFPDAIHATTQERVGRLALWLVRRGQSLLPWHGIGCIDDRGRPMVSYAIEVSDRKDYRPLFVDRENAPFVYCKRGNGLHLQFDLQ
jgi:hypothetical protein